MADVLATIPIDLPSGTKYMQLNLQQQASGFFLMSFDLTDNPTYPSGGAPATGANLVNGLFSITTGQIDANLDNDRFVWTALHPCTLVACIFQQTVLENTSAVATILPTKCASNTAPSAGVALLTAAVNLKTGVVANTPLSAPLSVVAGALDFAANDSLALDHTTAITEYVGVITFFFKPKAS